MAPDPEGIAAPEPPSKRARSEESSSRVTFQVLEERLKATKMHAKLPEDGLKDFICTHHGNFHADEAMACAMLKCLPAYSEMPILRTRNQAEIEKASIVVDVGGSYEAEKHRYDHHQRTFTDTYSKDYPEIKLSSAGLVFKHFGAEVLRALCGPLEAKAEAKLAAKVYDTLVRELDALDNGVAVADEPRYRIVTNLGSRVSRLNPSWREASSPALENERFVQAALLAGKELHDVVRGYCEEWLPARTIVAEALSKRSEIHSSQQIMKLPQFCPWQEHLFDLEEEELEEKGDGASPLTKYVLFQDSRGGWRIQAAPKLRGSFENRMPLPRPWCGLRDKELSDAIGLPGCVFVHAAGFIGGHESEEGVIEMAAKALEFAPLGETF